MDWIDNYGKSKISNHIVTAEEVETSLNWNRHVVNYRNKNKKKNAFCSSWLGVCSFCKELKPLDKVKCSYCKSSFKITHDICDECFLKGHNK